MLASLLQLLYHSLSPHVVFILGGFARFKGSLCLGGGLAQLITQLRDLRLDLLSQGKSKESVSFDFIAKCKGTLTFSES
jgi:hypothetical protein